MSMPSDSSVDPWRELPSGISALSQSTALRILARLTPVARSRLTTRNRTRSKNEYKRRLPEPSAACREGPISPVLAQ